MNNKPNNIVVESVCMRPYGPDHVLAHEHPAFHIFDDRNEFTRDGMKYMAVAVSLSRSKAVRAASGSFRAEVVNMATGECVSARTFSVSFGAGESRTLWRVDVPLKADLVNERYEYELRVVALRDGSTAHARGLRFAEPWRPRLNKAYVASAGGDAPMQRLLRRDGYEQKVVLELSDKLPADARRPQLCLHFRNERGHRCNLIADVHADAGVVRAECEVPAEVACAEELTVAVDALGRAVAQFKLGSADTLQRGYAYPEEGDAALADENFDRLLDEFIAESGGLREQESPTLVPAVETSAMDELDALIGLDEVKAKVRSMYAVSRFFGMRERAGLRIKRPPLHAMFLGSPGTGKTTVAGIMGRLLKEAGVLSRGHVVVRTRGSFVSKYYGDEEKAVREALKAASGGILFIDEAYQLNRVDDPKDPGHMVLEAMMTVLADESDRDWMLILAGYTEPTLDLLESNPGLASRIPATNRIVFSDYASEQLEQIADKYLADNDYAMCDDARELLRRVLRHDWEHRDASFGNARHVMNLLETGVLPAMAERVVAIGRPTESDLRTITAADIPAPMAPVRRERPRLGFAV
ncbi:MAG: AAA family ATPase [Muribaculaceae bacterium]|nr:AAA family ATPase [Muribaculaceae bacterium]